MSAMILYGPLIESDLWLEKSKENSTLTPQCVGWKLLAVNIYVKFNFMFCDGIEYIFNYIFLKEEQNSVQV